MSDITRTRIGREKAIALYESNWWELCEPREAVQFQLFTVELSMPFGVFHQLLEAVLGRSVWTHEMARMDDLCREFLGEREAPTFAQIVDMIPAEKRVIVQLGGE